MLVFQVPFLIVFLYIIYLKAYKNPSPSDTKAATLSQMEWAWLGLVITLFLAFNLLSIKYMPQIATARVEASAAEIQDIDVSAQSWAYQISDRQLQVGRPVRFSVKSVDTVHGFAVYHPDGRMLFTMMLIPGVDTSSIIHTFTEPGTYKVRCLEYCGIAHHAMQDALIVAAKP